MSKSLSGTLAGLGAASIWGGMYVVSKVVMDTIPPFVLITLRLLLGAGTLSIFMLSRGWPVIQGRHIVQILLIGFIGYGISLGFQFYGTKLSTASNGSLVTATTPAFVFPIAALVLGERLTYRNIIALILSTAGVLAVINPVRLAFEPVYVIGNLCLIAAAITWALYSVLVRKISVNHNVLDFSAIAFLGGLSVSLPLGVWEMTQHTIGLISWDIIGGILFLGIISTALAMVLWNTAFNHLKASRAGLTFFAQPLVGASLSVLFLKETISIWFLFGGILIASGIVLAGVEPGD